jgi:hypothetical protein
MRHFHIIGALFRGCILPMQRLKSALSNRGGNNSRQLEVVCHAPPVTSIVATLSRFPLSPFDRQRLVRSLCENFD